MWNVMIWYNNQGLPMLPFSNPAFFAFFKPLGFLPYFPFLPFLKSKIHNPVFLLNSRNWPFSVGFVNFTLKRPNFGGICNLFGYWIFGEIGHFSTWQHTYRKCRFEGNIFSGTFENFNCIFGELLGNLAKKFSGTFTFSAVQVMPGSV